MNSLLVAVLGAAAAVAGSAAPVTADLLATAEAMLVPTLAASIVVGAGCLAIVVAIAGPRDRMTGWHVRHVRPVSPDRGRYLADGLAFAPDVAWRTAQAAQPGHSCLLAAQQSPGRRSVTKAGRTLSALTTGVAMLDVNQKTALQQRPLPATLGAAAGDAFSRPGADGARARHHTVPGPRRSHAVPRTFELLLFATHPELVAEATAAGVDGVIVDWERRGKGRRQAGQNTQINSDTLADLRRVRAATPARVLCRVNGYGPWTGREIDRAIDAGADEVLLPMVRSADQVDRTLDLVGGRCGLGILIETQAAVRAAAELAGRPLSRVYVGLNDLRIDRGSTQLFEPLVDGTVEAVRAQVRAPRFGVAGLTLPDRGAPVPSRLLAAELTGVGADFTFVRRSFLADTAALPLAPAAAAIRDNLTTLRTRSAAAAATDRAALVSRVPALLARPA